MVIRARLVHKLIDGVFFRASCIVLFDRMFGHREARQEQLSSLKAQVLSAIRGAQMAHFLNVTTAAMPPKEIPKSADKPDELIPNPEYAT